MAQTICITGCSSGIGKITAQYFAERGWNVAATARNPEAMDAWTKGSNILALRLDVTTEATIRESVAAVVNRFGSIDVVVNNAGYGLFGPVEGVTQQQWRRLFETNVFGTIAVLRHVLPLFREQRRGVVINVSSLAGRLATPLLAPYHASKFAVEGLSESLRFELQPHGVRVKLIEPGHYKSDFITRSLEWSDHPAYAALVANMKGWVRRSDEKAGDPRKVAAEIFRAATDGSHKLRYPVGGRMLLGMRRLLPDRVWFAMLSGSMHRPAPLARAGAPESPVHERP